MLALWSRKPQQSLLFRMFYQNRMEKKMIFIQFIATVTAYCLVTLLGWYIMLEGLIGPAGICLLTVFLGLSYRALEKGNTQS